METVLGWPGKPLSTSRGPVFVRHSPDVATGRDPALFVHGLGGESLDWADVADLLRDKLDCFALDLPGFADSPPPADGDLSFDGHARAVADVARAVGGRVHLVGNSLGGAVATRVAAEHPELVRSLTLISPALPDLRPRFSSAQLTIVLVPLLGRLLVRVALRSDPERMAKHIYALCYGDPGAVSADRHQREIAALRRRAELRHSALVYRAAVRAVVSAYLQPGPRRLWQQAGLIGVPTLLIYGGRDKLVDPRMAARAQNTFPDAELVRLPAAGHVAHLEQPAEVAGALRAFLLRPDLIQGMAGGRGTVDLVERDASRAG
jgi:pimeloyl-ACP methyl ester carboxylesterase